MGFLSRLAHGFQTEAELRAKVELLERQNAELREVIAQALGVKVPEIPAPAPDVTEAERFDVGTGLDAFAIAIVGESRCQVALRELAGDRRQLGKEVKFTAVLVPAPENPADSNAIRVHINGGATVGHLAAEDAVVYKPVLDAIAATGKVAACRARLIGGTKGKWNIGVVLDLEAPSVLRQKLSGETQPF